MLESFDVDAEEYNIELYATGLVLLNPEWWFRHIAKIIRQLVSFQLMFNGAKMN
jgi:hypothetical protein